MSMQTASNAPFGKRSPRRAAPAAVPCLSFLLALILLSAATARAEILSTWDFSPLDSPLSAESTNAVALLGVRHSADADAAVLLYRNAKGAGKSGSAASDDCLTARFLDTAFLSAFSLVAAPRGAPAADGLFVATDSAEAYADAGLSTWGRADAGGENIGDGFGEWLQTGDSLPDRDFDRGMFLAAKNGGVGRAFEGGTRLVDGTFSVSAEHGFFDNFSGFALYADDAETGCFELLRWGFTTLNGVRGIYASIPHNGFNDYELLEQIVLDPGQTSLAVDYEIAWQTWDSGLEFQVSATGADVSVTSDWLRVAGVSSVSDVGVVLAGGSDKDTLRFDDIRVEGHVIPEPATAALLLLGAAVLAARHKKGAPK